MDLNSPEAIRKVDSANMMGALLSFPDYVRTAYGLPRPLLDIPRPAGIAVLGMGGSAIGGDLLSSCLLEKNGPPVLVNRDYELPSHVGPKTLVFAVSYSGNTEETLAAFDEAKKRGCNIVTISSGGFLAQRNDPARHVPLPGGLQPRAAVGLMLLPMIGVLEDLGVADFRSEVDETVRLLTEMTRELGPSSPAAENPAKAVALGLLGAFPMIFSGPFLAPVAKRWRTQLNENSKLLAREDVIPEMDHNDLVAWSEDPMAARCSVVLLRDLREHPRIAKRMELTRRLGLDRARHVAEVRSRGTGTLPRLLSALIVGDFASFYLAVLRGADPSPVKVIERLKRELAG